MKLTRLAVMAAAIIASGAVSLNTHVMASNGAKPPQLEFLGQAIIPTGTTFAGTTSAASRASRTTRARRLLQPLGRPEPAQPGAVLHAAGRRLDGHLDNGDVTFTGVTTLLAPDGQPYAPAASIPKG